MYVFKKQFWEGGQHFEVPGNSLMFMQGTTMYQFDKIEDPEEERFAMKLKDRVWAVYRGVDDIIQEMQNKNMSQVFQITNGDHQLILTQVL